MRRFLIIITFLLLIAALWLALTKGAIEGPPANPDSPVRNIIYAHVPSSISALLCFCVLLVAAIPVLAAAAIQNLRQQRKWRLLVAAISALATRCEKWDRLATATAEVGLVFATVLNLTGMIWSRAEWGLWWTASPRLVSAAVLWFLYVVLLILRSSLPGAPQRRARICAVFAIIAFLDVPMVIVSARFLPDIHRASFEFTSPWQTAAFFASMIATLMLAAVLITIRTEIIKTNELLMQTRV